MALFTINEIDHTTFGLNTIDKNDKPDTRESIEPQMDINDFKDISRNSNLKKRLKQFETNYEIRFTNKITKYVFRFKFGPFLYLIINYFNRKKWYDLLMNSQQAKSVKVASAVI